MNRDFERGPRDLLYQVNVFKHGDAALDKTVVAYLGPKNYDDLQAADTAAEFPTGFRSVISGGGRRIVIATRSA